jgi:hypothetical protein
MDAARREEDEGPDWPLDEGPPDRRFPLAIPVTKVARLLAMRREGLTYAVIAERLGIVTMTAWRYARAAGLTQPRLCLSCGRPIPGVRPKASAVGVCVDCRPARGRGLKFRLSDSKRSSD